MVRSVRLWRAVLQRSRSDWPVVLAAWLLLACATSLLATGALYSDTVAAGGVRRSLLDAPPESRAILVRTTGRPEDAAQLDEPLRTALAASIERTGGEIARVVRSGSFAAAAEDPETVDELTLLASFDGIERHATLLEGAWPASGANPVEAALSAPAAEALGVGVGGELALVSRLDESRQVTIRVVAIYEPDRQDPYWADDPLELTGIVPGDPYTNVGPVVVPRDDLLGTVGGRLEIGWRALPAIDRLQVDDVPGLKADIELLDDRIRDGVPGSRQFAIDATLPTLLGDAGRSVVVGRSGVTLLTIQFAVLAGYAVVLVGGLLLERRRAETALLRSRGATSFHLLLMALAEGLVLAAIAVAIAPWLALGLVRLLAELGPLGAAGIVTSAEISRETFLVAALAGLAGVVALALPTLTSTVSLAGVRAAIGRQTGRTLPQRLGIDLALVAVAIVAIWQLRLYGAPITRNARGALGVDPLLVAAPAIGLLGGAVLALRIVPRLAELAEGVLVRRRGLVAPLGGRQLARRPLRYTRAALLLMLAAGLATFATSHAATWTRSQGDQAAYQAATDVRVTPRSGSAGIGPGAGAVYRGLDGVRTAMPVTRQSIDLGRNVRGGPLLGLDPATAAGIVTFQSRSSAVAAQAALAALASAGGADDDPTVPIPGRPRRLAVVVDAAIRAVPFEAPYDGVLPADHRGLAASVVVVDADGRLQRIGGEPAPVSGSDRRLVVDLGAPPTPGVAPAVPAWPLRLVSVELVLTATQDTVLGGTIDLLRVEASEAAEGDAWAALDVDPADSNWRWTRTTPGFTEPYQPPTGAANRISIGFEPDEPAPVFPGQPATFRQISLPTEPARLPVVAGRSFLAATGAEIGDTLAGTTHGLRLPIEIVGAVDSFPPLDPGQPFVLLEAGGLELNRFALSGQISAPDEWWLDVEEGASGDVAALLGLPPFESETIVDRAAISRSLTTDPVSLGIIGALGLGAFAAMAFAAIGFVVSATVSTSERVGEFALLRALGLSGRQLAVWLSLESAFLLFIGLLAGVGLGVFLAWLVLPFATLTETGIPAVPPPIVVVPWQAIAPAWLLAIVLLAVTIVIVRRQLPSVRVSGVLRARDE